MSSSLPVAALYAAPSGRHGRGVFAGRPFRKGDVLERCPILCVSARERTILERTRLRGYLYQRHKGAGALALGFGSLYNHSADPNAECELAIEEQVLVFRALREIAENEEIRISYGDESELWFEARGDEKGTPSNGAGNGRAAAPRSRARRRSGRGVPGRVDDRAGERHE